jgi:D-alanyl-D-alanine carboxypeptidase (penicillin-binding protein 5/6)
MIVMGLTSLLLICLVSFPSLAFTTKAEYAILTDMDTGEVLFEKNADVSMAPSSMSKLMTIYMVFERLKAGTLTLEEKFTVTEKAWRKQGSKMYVGIHEEVSVLDLLRGIIVQSGNDACITIAEGLMGSEEAFVSAMNVKAKEIGLKSSSFMNSTGWPDATHLMTARDLSVLAKRLIKDFPEYYAYFAELEFEYNGIKQQNRNMLLSKDGGVDGLKTGHTDDAGYGITASSLRGGRRLILVVNGLSGTVERANEAKALFQYGFLNFVNLDLFKKGAVVETLDVLKSKEEKLILLSEQDIKITVPKELSRKVLVEIEYDSPLQAPIKKGDVVAELVVKLPQMPGQRFKLQAGHDVAKAGIIVQLINNLKYRLKKF